MLVVWWSGNLIRCSHGAPFFSTTTTFARPQLFPPTFALRSWQKKVEPALSRYRWQQGAPGQFLGFLIDRLAVIWYGKYFWILQQLFSCHILNLEYRVPRKSKKLKKGVFQQKLTSKRSSTLVRLKVHECSSRFLYRGKSTQVVRLQKSDPSQMPTSKF